MSFLFHSKHQGCKKSKELGYLEEDVLINQNQSYFTKSVIARLVLSFTFCDNFDLPISYSITPARNKIIGMWFMWRLRYQRFLLKKVNGNNPGKLKKITIMEAVVGLPG